MLYVKGIKNNVFTVLPLTQVRVHLFQTHAHLASAAALGAQYPEVLSASPCPFCEPLSLSTIFKSAHLTISQPINQSKQIYVSFVLNKSEMHKQHLAMTEQ